VQRRPLLFLICSSLCIACLRATVDSPSFVVQNQRLTVGTPTTQTPNQPAHATLPDGRVLSTWFEGTALAARINQDTPLVIDPHASAGCAPALVAFADNSALLIWRGDTPDNIRDIRTARFTEGTWQPACTLIRESWQTSVPPIDEGPAVDSRGPHVAVAWFTAADGPRINVSTSSSAGAQWLMPNRVDDISPIGRVSVALLDDGSQLVSWVERLDSDYVILLRRISSRGTLSVPAQLVRLATDPGHPLLTRIKDGDATPAQLRLDYTENRAPAARLITLPDAALLAEADVCDCDPRPEDQRGYALKGRIQIVDPNTSTITIIHDAIPGVMKASTTKFLAAPDLIAAAQTGQRILARTERIGPDWWLFNIRVLIPP
jgi:hypothetical protein